MTTIRLDRAALVRRAMVDLVAENGIHGASMGQVAQRAGVATGTAYVHYESKDDLMVAAFVEVKERLGAVATEGVDPTMAPDERFAAVWRRIYLFLRDDPSVARFLSQLDVSPLRAQAHAALPDDDQLTRLADSMTSHLVALPGEILYELGLAPAVRLVATDTTIGTDELEVVIAACWRAISRG